MVLAGVVLLTFLVFRSVFHHGFVDYDDGTYVVSNPNVQAGFSLDSLQWAFTTSRASNWHPLTWLSHILDWQLFGPNPAGHHAVSLLLHVANVALLFVALKRLTSAQWASALVSLLFAIHPLHVESVAWVSERKDVLSGFCFMLVLVAYSIYAGHDAVGVARRRLAYGAALAAFALGLMAKPMLVTVPCLLLLLDYWPLGRISGFRGQPGAKTGRMSFLSALLEKVPFFVLAAVSSVLTVWAQRRGGALLSLEHLPWSSRLANAAIACVRYIFRMMWPVDLSAFYPYPAAVHMPAAVFAAAGLLGCTATVVVLRKRLPWCFTGWLWFLGMLVPVIGIVQVGSQSMADRYTYLPLIGLFLIVVWGLREVYSRMPGRGRAGVVVVTVVAVGLLAWRCSAQAALWRSTETLFEHALKVTRRNHVAYTNLGAAYARSGRVTEAIACLEEAVRINPVSLNARVNLAVLQAKQGRPELAVRHLRFVLERSPRDADARFELANALDSLGRSEEAVAQYLETLHVQPAHAGAAYNLACTLANQGRLAEAAARYEVLLGTHPRLVSARFNLACALVKMGELEKARDHYARVIADDPKHFGARINFGNLLFRLEKIEEARTQYEAALAIRTDSPEARLGLGRTRLRQGNPGAALRLIEEALRLKPGWAPALRELAWVRATAGDAALRHPGEAVRLAEQACAGSGSEQPANLQALAAALAAAGRFPEAVRSGEAARELALKLKDTALAAAIERELGLYRSNQALSSGSR
jgi:tetratricopeptide (TPR) repeat protein